MRVKSESEVAQSCSTPSDPMDGSLPGSSVQGIFQARVLEWGAIAFSTVMCRREKNTRCYYPVNLGISGDDVVHGKKFQNERQPFYILPPVNYALATLDGNVSKMTFRPKQAQMAKISEH